VVSLLECQQGEPRLNAPARPWPWG
jgi:hypothetical protein